MTRFRQSARSASREIEGQAVVIVIDQQKLHTLNGVGTTVWGALDEGERSLDELVAAVVAAYEVEPARAETDVLAFLEQLHALGAVERLDEAS